MIVIAASLKKVSIEAILLETQDLRYGEFKKYVADIVVNTLETIQNKYAEIKEQNILQEVLVDGANKARTIANKKLKEVQRTIGIEL